MSETLSVRSFAGDVARVVTALSDDLSTLTFTVTDRQGHEVNFSSDLPTGPRVRAIRQIVEITPRRKPGASTPNVRISKNATDVSESPGRQMGDFTAGLVRRLDRLRGNGEEQGEPEQRPKDLEAVMHDLEQSSHPTADAQDEPKEEKDWDEENVKATMSCVVSAVAAFPELQQEFGGRAKAEEVVRRTVVAVWRVLHHQPPRPLACVHCCRSLELMFQGARRRDGAAFFAALVEANEFIVACFSRRLTM